ncbi:MAG: Wzz/FepE/Etk N-terminal domain-containing protein [Nitrospirota bacterium]|nr:Wzz/FepE/Etk N-terminal domain-containing protein [Nitrospirota bacterium]
MVGVPMNSGRAPQTPRAVAAPTKDLYDYLALLRRRKTLILMVAAALLAASAALAFLLPAVYRSTATILIEEQEIPPDLVRSAIATYADQRIETIKQQVLSRSTLWHIVEQYGLYKDLRKRNPTEEVLARFVKDIQIDVMNVKVIDKRTQNPTQATIAFTLLYDGESPELAQKVANELTSLFLGENLKTRERHAQETTAFLKREAESLSHHIQDLEGKLAEVKQRAAGALPELVQLNMQLLSSTQREVIESDRDIRSLKERKTYLEGELASLKPHTPLINASGDRMLDTSERLKALRAQYASASAYLEPEHPDLIKMKQELSSLEKEPGATDGREELSKRLTAEQASLAALRERMEASHPDVVKTQNVVASLERELQAVLAMPPKPLTVKPENPAYINIQSQLASTTASLQSLEKARVDLKRRLEEYAKRVETTPTIEPEYLDLLRDRENSVRKYQEITSRLMEAQVSGELEVQRKGERFSLINPPELPEKPDRPNRLAILLLGAFLAIAGGVGTGVVADNVDRTIYTSDQLGRAMGMAPLGVIPYLPSEDEVVQLGRRRAVVGLAGLGVVVVGAVVLHLTWMPLDVLWYTIMRKLG